MRAIFVAPLVVVSFWFAKPAFASNKSEHYKPPVSTTETTAAAIDPRDIATTKPPPEGVRISDRIGVEPLVGYGSSNWNFGAGGRIGYTFPVPVYLGGTFVWYSGDSEKTGTSLGISDTKTNYYYPGIEAGYDIGLARGLVVLRPYAGTAILYTRKRVALNGSEAANTDDQAMLYPGLSARLKAPEAPVFVGADSRFVIPLEQGKASYQVFFTAGLSL